MSKTSSPYLENYFVRERLFRVLKKDSLKSGWIQAPPGYGKSSLISGFVSTQKNPHVWFRFDDGDQELPHFFHFMLLAFKCCPLFTGKELNLPVYAAEYRKNPLAFARLFFRTLFDQVPAPFLWVLDNLEMIENNENLKEKIQIMNDEMAAEK